MGVLQVDAAVHLDEQVGEVRLEGAHLLQGPLLELLAAKAGLHGHHRHVVQLLPKGEKLLHRGAGLNGDAGLRAAGFNGGQHGTGVVVALDVEGNPIGAGLPEHGHVLQGVAEHQVQVELLVRLAPQCLYHLGPHGQIGHEVAVHNVDMKNLRFPHFFQLRAQGGEVRRQQRRRHVSHLRYHPFPYRLFPYCTR